MFKDKIAVVTGGDLVLEPGRTSYIIIPSQWSISCWIIYAVQPVKVFARS